MTQTTLPPGMGRCEITGKIVPDDELVTLHGQRVCAEGKAILLDRLKAGEAMPGEAERPTVMRRFACSFLDGLIVGVPGMIISFTFGAFAVAAATARAAVTGTPVSSSELILAGVGQLIVVIITITYFTLFHGTRGQSLGKMAGKLKVVRVDGQPMDMQTAFIRAVAYHGLSAITAVLLMMQPSVLQTVGNLVVGIYAILNVLCALFDRSQQRAIHDRIAGTRVIMMTT